MLNFKLETERDCKDMLFLLNRAANTLEPKNWPAWLLPLTQKLEQIVSKNSDTPA